MLEQILPFIKNIKLINYEPGEENKFNNQFVQKWSLKGNIRIDAVFCENSIFFKTHIPTTAILSSCLLLNCTIMNALKQPVVSLNKNSKAFDTEGTFKKISNSSLDNCKIKIIGSCDGSFFENCVITGGKFVECTFKNCVIAGASLLLCDIDNNTKTDDKTKIIGKQKINKNYNIKKTYRRNN